MPPESTLNAQGDAYRRGVVLGLTVAEVMLLLIFVLLLGFGFQLMEQVSKLQASEKAIGELELMLADAEGLAEYQDELGPAIDLLLVWQEENPNKEFDEFFFEITDQLVRLEVIEAAMDEQFGEFDDLEELQQALRSSREADTYLNELVEQAGLGTKAQELPSPELVADLLKDYLSSSQADPVRSPQELQRQVENLKGQIISLQGRLEQEGNGRVLPSCWTTAEGRSEYIFNIGLMSSGLDVSETNLPHRKDDRVALPIRSFTKGAKLGNEEFIAMSAKLFRWSEENNCRFYVRVRDATLPHEKSVYRSRLNAVERHFYKFEVN